MANPPNLADRLALLSSSASSTTTTTQNNKKKKKKKKSQKNGINNSATQTPIEGVTASNNQNSIDSGREDAVAGPSTSTPISSQTLSTMSLPSSSQPADTSKPVEFVEEYIAFAPSSDSEDDSRKQKARKSEKARGKEPVRDALVASERDWDRGKPRERERSRERGRDEKKRKHDAIDFDDGYANKKQRMDAASRKAPWVYDIDWDGCKNVSEM